ncbi:MAG: hypothetical protein BZ138_05885 [Methanosphaera sp. rholeuAM270]|nr:MAG: hypothetical protein BZ138_05885 [Methanosphaera sp. rholeuAM270]
MVQLRLERWSNGFILNNRLFYNLLSRLHLNKWMLNFLAWCEDVDAVLLTGVACAFIFLIIVSVLRVITWIL